MSSNPRSIQQALTGQVAIVTGGGRGIGRAIAQALAQQGAAVAVTARSGEQLTETVALITAAGGRAIAVTADVTDPPAVERVVTQTEQQLGPVDLLVNNAGVAGPIGPLWEIAPEEWWRAVGTHVYGMVLYAHAVLPGMVARHWGRIITVASATSSGTFPYASSYGCAKAAQVYLTETLAAETQAHNVYVFAIYPGLVRTAMTLEVQQSTAAQQWLPQHQARYAREESYVPPERAIQLVTFLATGQGDGLSGRYLSIADDVADLARRAEDLQRQNLYVLRLQR
jgi:NAD(P)-dependent dehydrogenase (short-subunit alcohol dehydrogenase family)